MAATISGKYILRHLRARVLVYLPFAKIVAWPMADWQLGTQVFHCSKERNSSCCIANLMNAVPHAVHCFLSKYPCVRPWSNSNAINGETLQLHGLCSLHQYRSDDQAGRQEKKTKWKDKLIKSPLIARRLQTESSISETVLQKARSLRS